MMGNLDDMTCQKNLHLAISLIFLLVVLFEFLVVERSQNYLLLLHGDNGHFFSWNIKIIFPENHLLQRLFTPSLSRRYEELYQENGVKFLKVLSLSLSLSNHINTHMYNVCKIGI